MRKLLFHPKEFSIKVSSNAVNVVCHLFLTLHPWKKAFVTEQTSRSPGELGNTAKILKFPLICTRGRKAKGRYFLLAVVSPFPHDN